MESRESKVESRKLPEKTTTQRQQERIDRGCSAYQPVEAAPNHNGSEKAQAA
jgi:hypothetical protein